MRLTHFRKHVRRSFLATLLLNASLVGAQKTQADSAKKAQRPLFDGNDAWVAGGFTALTFAMYPVDKSFAQRLQSKSVTGNATLTNWANAFDYLAMPGVFVLTAGSYAWGRFGNHPDMADFGWHTGEAVILGLGLTGIIKSLAGRSRPFVTADTNPHDWKFGSGIANDKRSSFPSGHTTIAFAAASAATSEIGRLWPKYHLLGGTLLYGSASLVGLARMYGNQHWASDVVVGAAIGTFAGLKVERYTHLHQDNWIDKIILKTTVTPAPGGGMLSFSTSFK